MKVKRNFIEDSSFINQVTRDNNIYSRTGAGVKHAFIYTFLLNHYGQTKWLIKLVIQGSHMVSAARVYLSASASGTDLQIQLLKLRNVFSIKMSFEKEFFFLL